MFYNYSQCTDDRNETQRDQATKVMHQGGFGAGVQTTQQTGSGVQSFRVEKVQKDSQGEFKRKSTEGLTNQIKFPPKVKGKKCVCAFVCVQSHGWAYLSVCMCTYVELFGSP